MVDLCPALLTVARRRGADCPPANVVEANASTWRPAAAVNVVFMSYSLTMMPQWRAVVANAYAMLAPGGRFGIVDFHLPQAGSRLANVFWQRWFAHDGVRLSSEHLPLLRRTFSERHSAERRAAVPYLPALRAPYCQFIGSRE
jgi:S-adenosylmethionine-diacylgycerolhomoserine-N-methlytransferase